MIKLNYKFLYSNPPNCKFGGTERKRRKIWILYPYPCEWPYFVETSNGKIAWYAVEMVWRNLRRRPPASGTKTQRTDKKRRLSGAFVEEKKSWIKYVKISYKKSGLFYLLFCIKRLKALFNPAQRQRLGRKTMIISFNPTRRCACIGLN